MKSLRTLSITLSLTSCVPAFSAEAADAIGLLTPGVPRDLFVKSSGWEVNAFTMGLLTTQDRKRGEELSRLARDARFDPAQGLSRHTMQALQAAGCSVKEVAVSRRVRGEPRPIGRDELPDAPDAAVLLDVTMSYAGLAGRVDINPFVPAFAVSYRLVSAAGELLQPSRVLYFSAPMMARTGPTAFGTPGDTLAVKDFATPSESCKFKNYAAAIEKPDEIWRCFDEGFKSVAERLAADLSSTTCP